MYFFKILEFNIQFIFRKFPFIFNNLILLLQQLIQIKQNKVVLIGDSRTGKTSIISRYVTNLFSQTQPTIGLDWLQKQVSFTNKDTGELVNLKLFIWDTAGSTTYQALAANFVRNAKVVILVFDLTNEESLNNLINWYNKTKQNDNEEYEYILVGNKNDCSERACSTQQIETIKQQCHCSIYIESSAKTGQNIEKIFQESAQIIWQKQKLQESDANEDEILLVNKKTKKGCC